MKFLLTELLYRTKEENEFLVLYFFPFVLLTYNILFISFFIFRHSLSLQSILLTIQRATK